MIWFGIAARGWGPGDCHIQNKIENILEGLVIIGETIFWCVVIWGVKILSGGGDEKICEG